MWPTAARLIPCTGGRRRGRRRREPVARRLLRLFHAPGQIVAAAADGHAERVVVASGGARPTVSVLDWRTGRLLRRIPIAAQPEQIAVDERTGRAFVLAVPTPAGLTPLRAGRLFVVDTPTGTLVCSIGLGGVPTTLAVDEGAGRVFAAEWGAGGFVHLGPMPGPGLEIWETRGVGSVQVVDARAGALVHTVPVGGDPMALAVDGRRHRVFVVNAGGHGVPTAVARVPITVRGPRSARGSVSVLDAVSGGVRQTIILGTTPRSIVLDPLARQAFVGDLGDDARLGRVLMLDTSGL